MKIKFAIIMLCITYILTGCADQQDDGRVSIPFGENDYENLNYKDVVLELQEAGFTNIKEQPLNDLVTGWLNDEDEVSEVIVDGNKEFSKNERFLPNVDVIVSYHTFPENEEKTTESTSLEETSKYDNSIEKDDNISPKNSEEFATLLSTKGEYNPIYTEFADKYKGKVVEFDGCITYVTTHGDYNTRYDLLLSGGDYINENTANYGPIFKFEDVNTYDMGIDDLYLPEFVNTGKNVYVIAEVETFDEDEGVFYLKPISLQKR